MVITLTKAETEALCHLTKLHLQYVEVPETASEDIDPFDFIEAANEVVVFVDAGHVQHLEVTPRIRDGLWIILNELRKLKGSEPRVYTPCSPEYRLAFDLAQRLDELCRQQLH